MAGKALLVIDMLNDFIAAGGALDVGAEGRKIVPVIASQLQQARREGWPVVFICDHHLADDREFEMFPPHCLANSAGAEIYGELAPRSGERVIYKRRYSGFYGTDLDLYLREQGVDELLLAGVCTNICILYTAADARMRNYQVTVDRSGVASFDQEAHRYALQELEKTLGATVI
jgi:nicotinamidase/pyrazinamidase